MWLASWGHRGLAFLMAREHRAPGWLGPQLKREFGRVYVANEGFTRETAAEVIASDEADAVAFGKLYIANPDLVERFAEHAELSSADAGTFYSHSEAGYVDYPSARQGRADGCCG